MNIKKFVLVGAASIMLAPAVVVSNPNVATQSVQAAKSSKKLARTAYVYNAKGKHIAKATLKKGKKVTILGTKKIKGVAYYRIGKGRYVKVSSFTKKVAKKSNTENTEKKETSKYANDPEYQKYSNWLKQRKKGKFVANKDTYLLFDIGDPLEKIKAGEKTDDIDGDTEIEKIDGEYYYVLLGSDNTNYLKCADFDFVPDAK